MVQISSSKSTCKKASLFNEDFICSDALIFFFFPYPQIGQRRLNPLRPSLFPEELKAIWIGLFLLAGGLGCSSSKILWTAVPCERREGTQPLLRKHIAVWWCDTYLVLHVPRPTLVRHKQDYGKQFNLFEDMSRTLDMRSFPTVRWKLDACSCSAPFHRRSPTFHFENFEYELICYNNDFGQVSLYFSSNDRNKTILCLPSNVTVRLESNTAGKILPFLTQARRIPSLDNLIWRKMVTDIEKEYSACSDDIELTFLLTFRGKQVVKGEWTIFIFLSLNFTEYR